MSTTTKDHPTGQIGDLYWHVHHGVLAEYLTEPLQNRIDYINTQKPERERAIRLRWLTPVLGEVPTGLSEAWADYVKACAANDKARVDYDKTWADYDKTWADYVKARADYVKTWADYVKTWADYDKTWAAYVKARADYNKTWAAYVKAKADYEACAAWPELEALHAIEHPGCPWNGRTLFPKGGAA